MNAKKSGASQDTYAEHGFSRAHCELAAEAAGRLAAMNQHPISEVFWRGTERLWRERLANFNKARRRS